MAGCPLSGRSADQGRFSALPSISLTRSLLKMTLRPEGGNWCWGAMGARKGGFAVGEKGWAWERKLLSAVPVAAGGGEGRQSSCTCSPCLTHTTPYTSVRSAFVCVRACTPPPGQPSPATGGTSQHCLCDVGAKLSSARALATHMCTHNSPAHPCTRTPHVHTPAVWSRRAPTGVLLCSVHPARAALHLHKLLSCHNSENCPLAAPSSLRVRGEQGHSDHLPVPAVLGFQRACH